MRSAVGAMDPPPRVAQSAPELNSAAAPVAEASGRHTMPADGVGSGVDRKRLLREAFRETDLNGNLRVSWAEYEAMGKEFSLSVLGVALLFVVLFHVLGLVLLFSSFELCQIP